MLLDEKTGYFRSGYGSETIQFIQPVDLSVCLLREKQPKEDPLRPLQLADEVCRCKDVLCLHAERQAAQHALRIVNSVQLRHAHIVHLVSVAGHTGAERGIYKVLLTSFIRSPAFHKILRYQHIMEETLLQILCSAITEFYRKRFEITCRKCGQKFIV